MKIIQESIFRNILRTFFVSLFGVLGAFVALGIILFTCAALISLANGEAHFSSKVKILSDAKGNRTELKSSAPVLLQISLAGEIGKDQLTGECIHNILLESRENEFKEGRIKGILLHIDSPGGGVNDSNEIYELLKQYKARYDVPIFAFVEGKCTSGGYYIACAADKIFASNVSILGSIGVISWPPLLNVNEPLKKLGISSLTLSAGKGKDALNPLRPWKAEEEENYQKIIDFYYNLFVDIVVSNRKNLTKEALVDQYGAKIFTAAEAKNIGLIDETNALRGDVLKALAKACDIPEEEKYQVITFETKNWWKKALKKDLLSARIKHEFVSPTPAFHSYHFL